MSQYDPDNELMQRLWELCYILDTKISPFISKIKDKYKIMEQFERTRWFSFTNFKTVGKRHERHTILNIYKNEQYININEHSLPDLWIFF
jgi:hypothetical protein